ncbi:MAG TPA: hypothetical protein VMF66_13925 [Candidatus Acidoferrum sp.]|nr:hypothetical protein [Candidatus Acidoferrum sp.]
MRFTALVISFLAAGLAFAGTSAAQGPQNQPPTPPRDQSANHTMRSPAWRMGNSTIAAPRVMTWRSRQLERREGWGGPLRIFSNLESDLDNPRIQTALGLSQQQVTSLRGILVNTEIYTIQDGSGILVDGIQLKQLLRSDHPDKTAVMAKGNAISQGVSQIINHYLNAILDAKNVLTPQQQDMIRHYMAMHGAEMGNLGFGSVGMPGQSSGPKPQW